MWMYLVDIYMAVADNSTGNIIPTVFNNLTNTEYSDFLDHLLVDTLYVFVLIIIGPVLLALINYMYLIGGLISKQIWKTKPFYLAFIALGLSDCILLAGTVILEFGIGILGGIHINPSSSKMVQVLTGLVNNFLWNCFNFSNQMLGVISILRFIAVYFPVYYSTKIYSKSGWIAILVTLITGNGPLFIGYFTVTGVSFQDPGYGDYLGPVYFLFNSPLPFNYPYLVVVLVIIPTLMSSFVPLTLYLSIAIKLKKSATAIGSLDRDIEYGFLFAGVVLCLTSVLYTSVYVVITSETMSFNQLLVCILIGKSSKLMMFGINPFVYWLADSSMKSIVTPPWKLIVTTVTPTETSTHLANPLQHMHGSVINVVPASCSHCEV